MDRVFRILIVDDDREWADSCKKKLDIRGVNVEVSYSVDDALEKIRNSLFHLVFCDYRMKYRDARGLFHRDGGFLICGHAKSHLPQAKLIMVTAYGTSDLARQSLVTMKFDDYMDKADNPKDDVASMRKMISEFIEKWDEESVAPNPFYASSGQMPKYMLMRLKDQANEMKFFLNRLKLAAEGHSYHSCVGIAGLRKILPP